MNIVGKRNHAEHHAGAILSYSAFRNTFRLQHPHKTGDFPPYIGNDCGIFESTRRNIIVSVFTANHFGSGATLKKPSGGWANKSGLLHYRDTAAMRREEAEFKQNLDQGET